jgi:hypothetical protein
MSSGRNYVKKGATERLRKGGGGRKTSAEKSKAKEAKAKEAKSLAASSKAFNAFRLSNIDPSSKKTAAVLHEELLREKVTSRPSSSLSNIGPSLKKTAVLHEELIREKVTSRPSSNLPSSQQVAQSLDPTLVKRKVISNGQLSQHQCDDAEAVRDLLRGGDTSKLSCKRGQLVVSEGILKFFPSQNLTKPDDHVRSEGYIWNPSAMAEIRCIKCGSAEKVTTHSREYRRAFGPNLTEWCVFERHKCTDAACQKIAPPTWSSLSPDALKVLPSDIVARFPFVTQEGKNGGIGMLIHKDILRSLAQQVLHGGSVSNFRAQIIEKREHRYSEDLQKYLRYNLRKKEMAEKSNFLWSRPNLFPSQDKTPELSFPSTPSLIKLLCQFLENSRDIEDRSMQQVDGLIICGDASHKVTKLIYTSKYTL